MEAIKKLRDKNIFNDQSIVESMIQKNWMGSPVIKKSLLRVKKINEDDCVCEELGEADGKAYKIRYVNILTVDGQELTKANLGAWQQKIGFVSQDIFLLDASIKENIAFGYHPKDIDLNRIDEVLEMAQLDKFVLTLPNGVDTSVGERGMQLSGGQLQRIGIARALYGSPEILVFDEATSNLDRISEKLIMETILKIGKSTTIIMIAHRLSTVKECDNIFLFNNGFLEDSGSYDYLQKTNSQFANLT